MNIASLTNHQVRLAQRPVGLPTRENWTFTTEPVAEPAEGGVLVKTLALSLDPAMRGWMNDAKSYIPPVGIGEGSVVQRAIIEDGVKIPPNFHIGLDPHQDAKHFPVTEAGIVVVPNNVRLAE